MGYYETEECVKSVQLTGVVNVDLLKSNFITREVMASIIDKCLERVIERRVNDVIDGSAEWQEVINAKYKAKLAEIRAELQNG